MHNGANWRLCIDAMKNLLVLLALYGAATRGGSADPNIYGPGGVNLGPNGVLPPSGQELQKDARLEAQQEQIRSLQDQVQQLQQQVQQLQEQTQENRQPPVQIEMHYGYPPQQNFGWVGGIPYLGSGFGGGPGGGRHHGGDHQGGGQHGGQQHRGGGLGGGGFGRH